jgi:hypothetical protein
LALSSAAYTGVRKPSSGTTVTAGGTVSGAMLAPYFRD